MSAYFFLVAIFLFVCVLPISYNRKIAIIFLLLFVFTGTRLNWTADYFNYEDYFLLNHTGSGEDFNYFSESGFVLLNKIMPSYRYVILFVSALYCFSLFFVSRVYIKPQFLFIIMLLYFSNFDMSIGNISAIRSCIVGSLFLFAIYFKIKGRLYASILLVLCGSLFHISGLFLLPLLLLKNKNHSKNYVIALALIVTFLLIVAILNLQAVTSTMVNILGRGGDYSKYVDYYMQGPAEFNFGNSMKFIAYLFILVVNLYVLSKMQNDSENIIWIQLSMIMCLLAMIPGIGMTTRFFCYLGMPMLIACQDVYKNTKSALRLSYFIVLICINVYGMISFTHYGGFADFIHYNSILFN